MRVNNIVKQRFSKLVLGLTALAFPATMFLSTSGAAAVTNVVVTPTNQQGWTTAAPLADNRPASSVNYIFDSGSPAPNGALQLLTDNTTASKAQYMHPTSTALSGVTDLSYSTKQVTPSGTVADPSYQLVMCLTGTTSTGCSAQTSPGTGSSFTTLVYEPYQGGQGTVANNTWQSWNIDSTGLFWSTRAATCSGGTITGSPGGPAAYTLAQVRTICPNAMVVGFGVDIGTNNPGYNVETDLFNFNGTVYNFELNNTPTDINQCKNGGFVNFTDENGNSFKNQGQCVAFVNRGSRVEHETVNTVNIHSSNDQSASSGNANSNNNTTGGSATSGNASNSNSNTNNVNTGSF